MIDYSLQHKLYFHHVSFWQRLDDILKLREENNADVTAKVQDIIHNIRQYGDNALYDYTKKFDHYAITSQTICVDDDEINKAYQQCQQEQINALHLAYERITDYHQKLLPQNLDYYDSLGVRLGARWNAIDAAGLYVPGGTAAYPSSVLMNVSAAKTAGVNRLVMVVPFPHGQCNPIVLAAAKIGGVDEVYKIGGAQAIAALAYGTETITKVDKVVGPGNIYVATAKHLVFGQVGIDMIAGPSEILIIADGDNHPDHIAMDLLSQCEHDTNAQAILITDDVTFAEKTAESVQHHLQTLPRAAIAGKSWHHFGIVIIVDDMEQAASITNHIAPEHLQLAVDKPDNLMNYIKHAGAVFMGRNTPEALGDYLAGPNHVLPTLATAKFSSGLSPLDFMKRTSFIDCPADALQKIGPATMVLAESESLHAHGYSIGLRLHQNKHTL